MSINEFLAQNPNQSQILEYVEHEAQRVAAERRKAIIGKQNER